LANALSPSSFSVHEEQQTLVPQPVWQRLVFGRNPRRTLIRATVLAATCFIMFRFFLVPIRIHGLSMEPAYHDGRVNAINRLAYTFGKPQRGEVVAARYSPAQRLSTPHVMLLKRIVGLPGETVAIARGHVLINGEPLAEPYVKAREAWEVEPLKLADDEYYLIGDNRGMDQRYHEFGRIEAKRIVGRVLW
jgi:signal peptidase I